ncbi:helix-turn-helix domain-containing protein [Desulfosarcina ovata]|uniref:Cytoskeleton protein RodZ-like C-terminal domain-containing protein n=2 Tax=Desulfosarcina ovata TaxID=83564 RepID=A0A5K8AKT3_9BACT|nr:helix-turn-helix domain-containing protein [Desulfosarcina ovata]BBO86400.1 hypothetical protein DSCO28_69660 [Desulfosarcina ovata subsp. sediminis]BBO93343.1 hypothetical protein DSCOOX_65230 [Desulfosarcina ovata subsp. ovata]
MESDSSRDTYGHYLQAFRLKAALSVEAVSKQTKIATHCLNAMEADDHAQLPPRPYVKSFIRSYAKAVGANADVALNLYLTDLERQAMTRQQRLKRQAKLSILRRTLLTIGIITSILLIVRYTDLFLDPEPPPDPALPQEDRLPPPATPAAQTDADPLMPVMVSEKLRLKVVAVEQTWLKVIVDGQNTRSYDLKPEERLELEGTRNFNLMIGNATGLQIFLNERPVKIYGSSGQVVSLKIP